jgi:hypothetical protein
MANQKCLRQGRSLTASLTGTHFRLRDAVARTWPLSYSITLRPLAVYPPSRLHHYANRHPLPAAGPVSLFGPANPSLPSMRGGFMTPCSASCPPTTAQVGDADEGLVTGRHEVAPSSISGQISGKKSAWSSWSSIASTRRHRLGSPQRKATCTLRHLPTRYLQKY